MTLGAHHNQGYTLRYVAALALIALLAIYSFIEMRAHITRGTQLSAHVDDAIYQYALANRIVTATTMVQAAKTEAEQQIAHTALRRSYEEFVIYSVDVQAIVDELRNLTRSHMTASPLDWLAHLLEHVNKQPQTTPQQVEALYYESPYNLDARFREIVSLTELFLASTEAAERRRAADDIARLVQSDVAEGTRLVSLGLQDITTRQFEIAALILSLYTALVLLTLTFIGSIIFRPLFQRVVQTEDALRDKIAEQHSTLQLIEQTETRLRVALEGMQDGLWDWDMRTNDVYYSDRWLAMLGYARDELPPTLEAWQRVVYPADRAFAYQELEKHFASPDYPYQVTLRYLHKDGGVRYILARGKALRDDSGKPYRMMGGHTDMTELTETQEILREQKLILELFTQNTPVAVAMLDRQLRFLNVSTRWLLDYNLTGDGAIGQSFFAVHSSFPVRWVSALREALSGIPSDAEEDSFEKPATKVDGADRPAETVYVRWRIQPWRDAQGFIGGVILFSEMISDEVVLRRDVARASGLNQALAEFVSTELLYTGTAIEPSIEEICRFAAQSLQAGRVSVWHMDDDAGHATCLRLYNAATSGFESGGQLSREDCFAFFGRLTLNRPVVLEDTARSDLVSPAMLKYLDTVGVRAALVIPVRVEQKIWGFMAIADTDGPRQWLNYEEFFSQRLADVVAISITAHQRQQLNASLVKAREAAEAATVMKSRFVANMSHEVRTPLNGIIGVTEILSRTDLSAKQDELVGVLQNSCHHLLSLVNDILDFSKLEAGGVALESIAFDPEQLVRELVELLPAPAAGSAIEIVVNYQPRLPHTFIGDPTRVRQVLMNLLSNAIKFTSKGTVSITLTGHESGAGQWQLVVAVADSGIGIAPDKIDTLFEKFTQADTSTTRKYGGTGLGLSITRELVELMGGTIAVQSELSSGSTFTVTLPLQVNKAPPARLPSGAIRGLRVLLFDDNPIASRAIEQQLTGLGIASVAYAAPTPAFAAAQQAVQAKTPFDIALIDVGADASVAMGLVETFKRDSTLRDVSLIALRDHDALSDDTLLTKGFIASIRKPVLPSVLLQTVQAVATARRTGDISGLLNVSAPTAARTNAPTISKALQGAKILLAEDNETNQMIVSHLLNELGCATTVVANGREAVRAFTATPDFAAVLMDCQMPEMDGFAATAAIRQHDKGNRVPIIALTANVQGGDREACLAAGMNDYMAKPVRLDALREKLLTLLNPGANSQPPASITSSVPDLPPSPLNMADLRAAFGDDDAVVSRVIASFLASTQELLAKAGTQITAADWMGLAATAHAIKGTALNVYAAALADDARKLETAAKQTNALECGYLLNLLRRHVDQIAVTTKA